MFISVVVRASSSDWGLFKHLPHCTTKKLCEHPGILVD